MHRWSHAALALACLSSACLLGACLLSACKVETGHQFHARFEDAGGLTEDADVYISGVRVGRVDRVALEEGKALVAFSLTEDLELHEDACASVSWYGVRESHLRLDPGSAGAPPLQPGSEVRCVRDPSDLSTAANKVMTSAGEIVTKLLEGKGTLGRLLRDEELADKVERFFEAPSAPSSASAATSAAPGRP